MPDQGKPATGPVILEHVLRIQEDLHSIGERLARLERVATERHKIADRRYERTDQYIVGEAFNVDAVLKQTISALDVLRKAVQDEQKETRAALRAHFGGEDLARERNGN